MLDPGKAVKKSKVDKPASTAPATMIVGGIVFGFLFGFLLQKGGVGTYHILIGQLLFQDWTVVKIMLTAIVVGMIGIFTLHHFAKVNLHTKPTKLAPNIVGGLLFGVGFALDRLLSRHSRCCRGPGKLGRSFRHGRSCGWLLAVCRDVRHSQTDNRKMGQPREADLL